MNWIKKNLFKILSLGYVFAFPILSLAVESGEKILNPIGATTITGLIKTILEGIIKIGLPVIALAIIYSGFLFVSAQGNPEKVTEAKRALLYTLIGAAILLGSWAIAQLISETVRAL